MKRIILGIAAIGIALSATAQNNSTCDSMLQALSDAEMKARTAYLADNTSKPLQLMTIAAKSFDNFASRCGLGPMAYLGVLVHGRLSMLYRDQGKRSEADVAATSASKYAEALHKRKVEWSEIERIVREADIKQRAE